MKLLPALTFTILCIASRAVADSPGDALAAKAEQAWKQTWARFFNDSTGLFYDYISSYESGHELEHLPTADEVKRQYPNPCGQSGVMNSSRRHFGPILDEERIPTLKVYLSLIDLAKDPMWKTVIQLAGGILFLALIFAGIFFAMTGVQIHEHR
jgi:hypothetical protein